MANTLKDFYIKKRDRIKASEINAKSSLSKATKDLGNAKKAYDKLVVAYTTLEEDLKKKREALNQALMPSDIESLAVELRQLLLQFRKKRREILAVEQQLSVLQRDKDLAEVQLTRAGSALTAADAQVQAAETREDQHVEWKQAVADGSLTALADQAEALLEEVAEGGGNGDNGDAGGGDGGNGNGGNGEGEGGEGESGESVEGGDEENSNDEEEKTPAQKVKSRIETDIPAALRARARERGQRIEAYLAAQNASLRDIENELDTHRESTEGASGLSAKRRREYLRAEDAFKDYVLQSPSRYDQALSLIQIVNASADLTEAEKGRIHNDADHGGVALSDGADALTKEKALGEARAAASAKDAEIKLAIVKARIKDIDTDPEDDAVVQAKRGELNTLYEDVTDAEGAYTEAMRNSLDLWEAAVPDHIWANLVAYDNADTLLTGIKDGDPNALATAMKNAEKSLVTAVEKEDQGALATETVTDRITLLNAGLEYLRNAHHQRKLSAVRGDA